MREQEQFAQEEWTKLPAEECRYLIHSYSESLSAVIVSKACATKPILSIFIYVI